MGAAHLTVTLADAGHLRRFLPAPTHTPITYLWDAYTATHAATLDGPDVHYHGTLTRDWNESRHILGIEVLPDRHRVTRLHTLRAALDHVHPELFGAVLHKLHTRLAAYDPIFHAGDACDAELHVYYGDSWFEAANEAYMEAHDLPGDAWPEEEAVLKWHQANGYGTPDDVTRKYPQALYKGDLDLLTHLAALTAAHHPGVPALRDFLAYLDTLPPEFACTREWASQDVPWNPGQVNVLVYLDDPIRDPVLEAYREVTDYFGDQEEEPLSVARIAGVAEHLTFLRYLTVLKDVQARTAQFWAAVSDA